MRKFKPFVLASLAVAMLVGSVAPAAAASGPGHSGIATDAYFVGSATSGAAAPNMPITINPADITMRVDGSVGIGYIYTAAGQAWGKADGRFTYEEHGYMYFGNPADPSTYRGSQFKSGVFTLTLRKGGVVTIIDTDPAAYTSGIKSVTVANKGFAQQLDKALGKNNTLMNGNVLTYGYFSFTDNYGTFTGYATPDFRQFAIGIKFDCAVC